MTISNKNTRDYRQWLGHLYIYLLITCIHMHTLTYLVCILQCYIYLCTIHVYNMNVDIWLIYPYGIKTLAQMNANMEFHTRPTYTLIYISTYMCKRRYNCWIEKWRIHSRITGFNRHSLVNDSAAWGYHPMKTKDGG